MSILTTVRAAARHRRMSRLEMAAYIAELEGQNTSLIAENTRLEAQLNRAAVDVSGLGEDLRVARGENLRLKSALAATNAAWVAAKAELANATAHHPLPQHVTTQPIPALYRYETGPVLRAGASPLAAVTDPGQTRQTTWGRADADTQPLPTAAPAA